MAKKKNVEEEETSTGWDEAPTGIAPGTWETPSEEVSQMVVEETGDTSEDDWGDTAQSTATRSQIFIEEHAGDFDEDKVKMLIYGESGAGKTRFASGFPDVLFVDIDKGMSSVDVRIDKISIDTFEQVQEVYKYLKAGNHKYSTVVIDTLNEFQRIAMRATVQDFPNIRRSYGSLPGQSDYGKMLYDFLELTRDFVNLPMRVILLAQVNSRVFETDVQMPQLIGKNSAREISRKMDVIGYIEKSDKENQEGKKVPHILFDSQYHVTKDRSYRLPAILEDASFERMRQFWK